MNFIIRKAEEHDLSGIMKIMKEAENNPVHPQWFVSDEEETVRAHLTEDGFVIVAETEEKALAGFFIVKYPELEENLGTYLSFSEEELEKVVHMDSAVVSAGYRGHGLQGKMLKAAEDLIDKDKWKYLMCTVHPENRFSLSNMTGHGYEIRATVQCYGGLTRHILVKEW